jgi:hypothetical protein
LQAASVYTLGSLDAAATLTGLLQVSATFTDLLRNECRFSGGLQAAVYTLGSLDATNRYAVSLLKGTSATFTDNVTVLNEASVRRLYAEDVLAFHDNQLSSNQIDCLIDLDIPPWDRPPTVGVRVRFY